MNKPQGQQFSVQQLNELINLTEIVSGELPTEIRVRQEFYDWYISEIFKLKEDINNLYGFTVKKDSVKVTFRGIELIRRLDK